jgi:hypothetical protein
MVTKLFTFGQNDLKTLLVLSAKNLWISFEQLGKFS